MLIKSQASLCIFIIDLQHMQHLYCQGVYFLAVFVPLSHVELSCHAVGLVLNHIRHEVWTQLYIGSPVASHVVIIGGREQGEDLMKNNAF